MTRIGLISDTHNYLDEAVFKHFTNCDEIWHAGDFGTSLVSDALTNFKPLRGVYGNIDGFDIRSEYPETLVWECEQVKILMIHILVLNWMLQDGPGAFAKGEAEDENGINDV